MLHILNKTPFQVDLCPIADADGYDRLLVFLSVSCELEKGNWHVSEPQMNTPLTDIFWDPDNPSSIRYPAQLALHKPATDVIINGTATAPGDTPVTTLAVSVELASQRVQLQVFGERVWYREAPSSAQPFTSLPLRWEHAYGGTEYVDDVEHRYDANPLGRGWRPDSFSAADYHGCLMPGIEWPEAPLRSPKDRVRPAGFGALPAHHPERASLSGRYDTPWLQQQAPFVPLDFDPRYFNSAIPELQFPGYLTGNESVRLKGFTRSGSEVLHLPGMAPSGAVRTMDRTLPLAFTLQTLVIETDTMTVRLFWQAHVPILRTLAEIDEITVHLRKH